VTAFGSYLHYENGDITAAPGVVFDGSEGSSYVVGINATYTVVPGLTIQPEVSYQKTDEDLTGLDDGGQFQGGVRIKRIF